MPQDYWDTPFWNACLHGRKRWVILDPQTPKVAYIVMAYIVMASVVMAYVVTAYMPACTACSSPTTGDQLI